MRLITLIKLVKLFVLWSESDPLLYRWCRLSNPIQKTIPGIPIDVVAVNYAVFAISNFINYYLMYLYFMSNIAGKEKIFEWSVINKNYKLEWNIFFIWSEIKYDINSKISFKK